MKSLLGVVLLNLCVTLSSFAQLEQIHKETIFSYYSNLAFSQDSQYILKVTPDISRKNSVITVLNNKLEVISEVVLFGNDPEVKLTPDGQNYVVLTQNNAVFIFDIFGGLVDTYCEVGGCKKVGNWRDIKINSSSDHALFFSQENGLSLRSLTGELKFHHTYKNNYIPFGFVPNKSMFWYQEYDKRVVFLNLNAEVLFEINWEQLGHNGSRGILVDTSNEEKLIILDSSTNKIWIFDYTGQLISNFTVEK